MPKARDNLCPHCGGRGFEWLKGAIIGHDGTHIAHTYQQGPICTHCGGSGKLPNPWVGAVIGAVIGLVILAFVAIPLARAIGG